MGQEIHRLCGLGCNVWFIKNKGQILGKICVCGSEAMIQAILWCSWLLNPSAAGLGEEPGALERHCVINGLYHLSNRGSISGARRAMFSSMSNATKIRAWTSAQLHY